MQKNFKAKKRMMDIMSSGRQPYGIFVSSRDAAVTGIMAGAGFDFVQIDCEHSPISLQDLQGHVLAAEAGDILPFVRILQNSRELIQATLDTGVEALIVPHVDTADDARRAVAAARYAPKGLRGMCPANHAGGYSMHGFGDYMRRADENVLIMPIIESRRAVENIDEIIAVDGVDFVHFGPGDLSVDMGIDLNTEFHKLMEAWFKVRDAVHKANKFVFVPGGFGFDGGDVVYAGMEYMILQRVASEMVAEHRAGQKK